MEIYAVYDRAVGKYMMAYESKNRIEGVRTFDALVNYQEGVCKRYPAEFELWLICGVSIDDGKVTEKKEFVVGGETLRRRYEGVEDLQ